ncbi:MAG: glycosyltransferase [Chitinophagales bacterium]|nr:glycosyltransferase [Chitinophagales bacterium]
MILAIVFLVFVSLFIYSYLIYPSSLHYLGNKTIGTHTSGKRPIVVLLAAYNEENHISKTIQAIFNSNNLDNIEMVIVADDGSEDETMKVLQNLQIQYSKLKVERLHRIGKPQALNFLVEKFQLNTDSYHILLMDANIALDTNCIIELEKEILIDKVGMVGASVVPLQNQRNVESDYVLRENRIKLEESRTMGYAIGVFGACYMMRGELYQRIPKNFITDDLFLTFSVIGKNYYVLYSQTAIAKEHISAVLTNEFKRKSRYAAGNFQILFHFLDLLNPWKTSFGFIYAFFFHKILRWLSPILFLVAWILSFFNLFGQYSNILIYGGSLVCLFLFFNYLLTLLKINAIWYRMYYFLSMNLAILYGFFNYIKGIKTNVWERSDRI